MGFSTQGRCCVLMERWIMNGNMKAVTEWCRIKTNRAVGGTKITHAGGQRLRFAVCVCVWEREGGGGSCSALSVRISYIEHASCHIYITASGGHGQAGIFCLPFVLHFYHFSLVTIMHFLCCVSQRWTIHFLVHHKYVIIRDNACISALLSAHRARK